MWKYFKYWKLDGIGLRLASRLEPTSQSGSMLSSNRLQLIQRQELQPFKELKGHSSHVKGDDVHTTLSVVRQSTLPSQWGHHATSTSAYLHFHCHVPFSCASLHTDSATLVDGWSQFYQRMGNHQIPLCAQFLISFSMEQNTRFGINWRSTNS